MCLSKSHIINNIYFTKRTHFYSLPAVCRNVTDSTLHNISGRKKVHVVNFKICFVQQNITGLFNKLYDFFEIFPGFYLESNKTYFCLIGSSYTCLQFIDFQRNFCKDGNCC